MGRLKRFNQDIELKNRVPLINMKELRKKNNLSLDGLSRITGITSKHLWNIETGRSRACSISDENKRKICKALGVKVEELFSE
jgi:transcriptional regulator with XRE-family HTH domain